MSACRGSESVTQGVKVLVQPQFMPDESSPENGRYIFAYRIRITNEGPDPATLVARHWVIVDGEGERQDVRGEGVVGQQPRLSSGDSFEYSSYCPLAQDWGTMEGVYRMRRDDGREFDVEIGRFFLVAERKPEPAA